MTKDQRCSPLIVRCGYEVPRMLIQSELDRRQNRLKSVLLSGKAFEIRQASPVGQSALVASGFEATNQASVSDYVAVP